MGILLSHEHVFKKIFKDTVSSIRSETVFILLTSESEACECEHASMLHDDE